MWEMRRDGLSLAEIGRRLGITRQGVYKNLKTVDAGVAQVLETTAKAAKIEARYIDSRLGILLGYSHEVNDKAIVTFSAKNGPHIWNYYTRNCSGCELEQDCRQLILDEARERGIELAEDDLKKSPAELANTVFSAIIPDVEW